MRLMMMVGLYSKVCRHAYGIPNANFVNKFAWQFAFAIAREGNNFLLKLHIQSRINFSLSCLTYQINLKFKCIANRCYAIIIIIFTFEILHSTKIQIFIQGKTNGMILKDFSFNVWIFQSQSDTYDGAKKK